MQRIPVVVASLLILLSPCCHSDPKPQEMRLPEAIEFMRPSDHVSMGNKADSVSARHVDPNYQGEGDLHLEKPLYLAVDQSNNLYISVVEQGVVFKVDKSGATTVVAGTGKRGRPRVGVPATQTDLLSPMKLLFDDEGNLYIADGSAFRVFKVDMKGILTAVAGTGVEGPGGDGGPAVSATLASPYGIAIGPDKSLFILDGTNNWIRKVSPDGIISTIAGTGKRGRGGDGGPASAASLYSPTDIAIDRAGDLFIADRMNSRIRKIDHRGIITTVAGNGTMAGYDDVPVRATLVSCQADSIAFDDDGNLFMTDGRIRRLDKTGIITTVAGRYVGKADLLALDSKFAPNATLVSPFAVVVDHEGNLYFADWAVRYSKSRVRKVSAGIVTEVFTSGPSPAAEDSIR